MGCAENKWKSINKELLNRKLTIKEVSAVCHFFKEDIHSPRMLDCIQSSKEPLKVLLEVLDSLDILYNAETINTLNHIFSKIYNKNLFNHTVVEQKNRCLVNEFEQMRQNEVRTRQRPAVKQTLNCIRTEHCVLTGKNPKERLIYEILSQELGNKWREFGGYIGVRQGELDHLQEQYPDDIRMRVLEMLRMFEDSGLYEPKDRIYVIRDKLNRHCKIMPLSKKIDKIWSR